MSRKHVQLVCLIILSLLISGCAAMAASGLKKVPVKEGWRQPLVSAKDYTVKKGDTLYSIAWSYGLDYRDVAKLNNIPASYQIHTGQKLHLVPPKSSKKKNVIQTAVPGQTAAPSSSSTTKTAASQEQQETPPPPAPKLTTKVFAVTAVTNSGINWAWPARGCVIHNYSASGFNKGIDIVGRMSSPILAAASGKVVYAGNGLRGYGNLIIIKHNAVFLSAYAHNQRLCVQDGQTVKMGQVIAYMGNTEARRVMVHFEIRKAGKPVDPMAYLPCR